MRQSRASLSLVGSEALVVFTVKNVNEQKLLSINNDNWVEVSRKVAEIVFCR